MKPLIFTFPADARFGEALTRETGAQQGRLSMHEFPDGEVLVRLEHDCAGRQVVFVCGGQSANSTALPLHFAAATARDLGAVAIGLVSPYLAYMRQDARFHPGDALSAVAYAGFLGASFDWLITVEPHLHRFAKLDDLYPMPAHCVSTTEPVATWIEATVPDPVVIGPDNESRQWAARLGSRLRAPVLVLEKIRSGDRDVQVRVPDSQVLRERTPVIIDDIASSGHTLARTVEALLAAGSQPPVCIVMHALFGGDALAVVRRAGASRIVSTNTIAHPTNQIDVAPLVAAELSRRVV
jgi:ribose-phosphate pyrophosphokinase